MSVNNETSRDRPNILNKSIVPQDAVVKHCAAAVTCVHGDSLFTFVSNHAVITSVKPGKKNS